MIVGYFIKFVIFSRDIDGLVDDFFICNNIVKNNIWIVYYVMNNVGVVVVMDSFRERLCFNLCF